MSFMGQEFDMNHLMAQLADLDMQLNRLQRSGLPASLTSTPPPTPASRGQTPHISGTSTPSWSAGLARADLDDMAAAYGLGPLDTASQLAQAARSLRMQSSAGQKSVWDQIAELSRTGPSSFSQVEPLPQEGPEGSMERWTLFSDSGPVLSAPEQPVEASGAVHRPGATLKRSASCSSVHGDRSSTYKQPRLVMGDDVIWLPVMDQSAPGSDRLGFSRANQQLAGLGLSHLGGMSSDDLMGLSGPLPQQQGGSAGRLGEAEAVWAALAASSQAWPAVPTAVGREDHSQEGWAVTWAPDLPVTGQAWPAVRTAVGRESQEGWAVTWGPDFPATGLNEAAHLSNGATFPEAWEPFNDVAPAAGAPSAVPDLMQWSVHSQRCPEGEGLLPTPDLWAPPGGNCTTSTNVTWLPELPGLDLNGTAESTRVHTPHPNGSSGADRFGLRMPSQDLGDLPRMGSPTAAAVALAGSHADAAAGLSSSGNDGAAGCAGAGANSREQAEPAGSAASGCGLPRAAAASSGAKADPAALEQLVLFSKLLVEAMGETGEGESPAGQAAAALRRLDSAGSFDSSTSGAAGAACTGRGSGSPVMDPKDVQAVAAAMLLLREGEAPGPDPSTARTEVWGPHAGPAVAQTGSDLSSIYSQDFEELEGHSDLEADFFSADEDAEDGPVVKPDLEVELPAECLPERVPWSKPVSRPSELGRVRRAWGGAAINPTWPSRQPQGTSVTVATQTADEGSMVLPGEREASAAAALMASLKDAWSQADRPVQEAAATAPEGSQSGVSTTPRQLQQHHRVLHLCRRPPPRPAVAGRALMRGFLLDGNQGSVQAACQAGGGVTRAEQLAPESHVATTAEGALLRPADWLAAMAVNPVQGCRLAAHIQPQLPPLRQLLPPLGPQLLAPAHSPFVLPPELHPAKIVPGTETQRNVASTAAPVDAQVEAASPQVVATKAKAKELAAAAAAFVARRRHESLSLSAEQLAFCKRPSPELSAEEVDYMTLPASKVDVDDIRRSHAVDLEDVASMCSEGSFVDCHLSVPCISCSTSVAGSLEVVDSLESHPSIADSSDLAVESWALVDSGTAAGDMEVAGTATSEEDGCAVIAADAEAIHEYAASQASEEEEWEVVHTETH